MLCVAARNGSRASAQALLRAKAHPDRPNRFGDTPLMLAALKGDLETVRALVAGGAAVNRPGWTPLIYAATGGHDGVADFLLTQGADIDAASPNGTTALMMAVHEHHPETARLLIGRGADVNHRNQEGATALAWARRNNEDDLVKELRRAGATQ
jgi:ankyrin repeat protein